MPSAHACELIGFHSHDWFKANSAEKVYGLLRLRKGKAKARWSSRSVVNHSGLDALWQLWWHDGASE